MAFDPVFSSGLEDHIVFRDADVLSELHAAILWSKDLLLRKAGPTMSILPSSKGKTQGEDTTSDKGNKHGVKWCMDKKNVRLG